MANLFSLRYISMKEQGDQTKFRILDESSIRSVALPIINEQKFLPRIYVICKLIFYADGTSSFVRVGSLIWHIAKIVPYKRV